MKGKGAVFAILAVPFVLVMNSGSRAVDTGQIDRVRSRGVLDSEDLEVIDTFVAEGVQELGRTRDFTSIAKVRTVISSRNSSSRQSAATQYAEQFSESAYKYISEAFETADELTPEEDKFKMILNLLILVDALEDLRLAELAVERLDDENKAIRYWAIHCVTNLGITEQLNSGQEANLRLAKRIVDELKKLVENSGPETLVLMAEFAAGVDVPQAEELLLQIADTRIKRYADWTVEYELLDGAILKLLDSKIPSGSPSKAAVGRRFGQLYSYVLQRYVKGRDFLGDVEKQQLASVLVETEILCISKRVGPQSVIKKAVERDDYIELLQEHSRLLGDETRAGELPLRLNFDYGEKSDGGRRIAPLALAQPPKTKVSE